MWYSGRYEEPSVTRPQTTQLCTVRSGDGWPRFCKTMPQFLSVSCKKFHQITAFSTCGTPGYIAARSVSHLLTYLLTYSIVQSPYWEANWFVASQEIPPISREPKVHYRTHKRPPPVSITDQPNPVHIPTSHLLKIHPNIIHPSTPRSPQWPPSLRFSHEDPIHPPLLTSPHGQYLTPYGDH